MVVVVCDGVVGNCCCCCLLWCGGGSIIIVVVVVEDDDILLLLLLLMLFRSPQPYIPTTRLAAGVVKQEHTFCNHSKLKQLFKNSIQQNDR